MQLPRSFRRLAVFCALLLTALGAQGDTQYYLYDDVGRLSLATFSDGSAIAYIYDENGNRTAVLQYGTPTPVISSFQPPTGQSGVVVTIYGSGFSTTPAENAVTFNGLAASVTGASATTLTAVVPFGAETGPIAVTTGGAGSSSVEDFVVLVPSITDFSPTIANPLNNITIEGNSLYLVPGQTSVTVGSTAVTELSFDNEEIVFDAPTTSGPITVTTPYGSDTSAGTLVVVPTAISPGSVWDVAEVALNEEASLNIGQQSAYGLFVFQGNQNQYLRIRLTALQTTPAGQTVNWVAYSPTGSSIASGTRTSSTLTPIYLPKIATTGIHVISFRSTTSSQVTLTGVVEPFPEIPASGTTTSIQTTVPGEGVELTFVASAGDDLSLALTNLNVSAGSTANFRVYRPSGSMLEDDSCAETTNPGCAMELRNVTQNGMYRIVVTPSSSSATMTFNLTLTHNIVGGALAFDTPVNVSLPIVGQYAEYTFTATAGQTVALHKGSVTMTPSSQPVHMRVLDPSGSQIYSSTQPTANLQNLAAGTHTVILYGNSAATGTLVLTLATGVVVNALPNGSNHAMSTTVPEQSAYINISAVPGDDFYVALTGINVTGGSNVYVTVHRPSGSYLISGTTCAETNSPGCAYDLTNLTQTGIYKMTVSPYSATGAIAFTATVSTELNVGTLALNTSTPVNMSAYGQRARANFTATAGQNIALQVTGISTTPSGKSVNVKVFNPSGSQIHSSSPTSSSTINLTNLAAGSYSILLTPSNAAMASLNLEID